MPRLFSMLSLLTALATALNITAAESPSPLPLRPNILWITCEDISSHVGCFGDTYAVTPNIDALAREGVRYRNAFATIGVCAPARSTIITGMYPPSIGTHHMRCKGTLPDFVRCYPEYLREAGYYTTNNHKTDYNLNHPRSTWDESSRRAHWRKRKDKQPFFSIFNFTTCHESQIRLPERGYQNRVRDFAPHERHDPALASIPPYHPDTPEVRRDWARYADMITFMDKQVGNVLRELETDGLAESTIVFFYSDHGAGMPRSKRWLYDSSTRVPMIVRFPKAYQKWAPGPPGSMTDRLVSFVDLAPTVLSLAGLEIPKHFQGHAFLGPRAAPPRKYVHGFRDRMDERYDMIRSVRDHRFRYMRNYLPHLPYAQHISYMYQMPTMQVWQQMATEGKLRGPQKFFFQPKATEELYDTWADPHEVNNLAANPAYRDVLERMRQETRRWMTDIVDLGLLPEPDLRARFGGEPQYTAVRAKPDRYPQARLLAAADLANRRDAAALPELIKLLSDSDPAVRYWGAIGCVALKQEAAPAAAALRKQLQDPAPAVRVAAAEALAQLGHVDEALKALAAALEDQSEWGRLSAANVIDRLDERARPVLPAIEAALSNRNKYIVRVVQKALRDLKAR